MDQFVLSFITIFNVDFNQVAVFYPQVENSRKPVILKVKAVYAMMTN